jgi:hypothetical protein
VLKAALRDGHVKPPLPFEGLGWQRVDQKTRHLYTPDEIDRLCEVASAVSKNGRQFCDYIRFLQYSGARRNEALAVRWQDVDFERGHVTIGAEGNAKNREARHVDFNPKLEAHLKAMSKSRALDLQWPFPSPQRGERDVPAKTFMESLRLTRNASGCACQDCQRFTVGAKAAQCGDCGSERVEKRERLLPPKLQRFGFHDLRHHFISYAVMRERSAAYAAAPSTSQLIGCHSRGAYWRLEQVHVGPRVHCVGGAVQRGIDGGIGQSLIVGALVEEDGPAQAVVPPHQQCVCAGHVPDGSRAEEAARVHVGGLPSPFSGSTPGLPCRSRRTRLSRRSLFVSRKVLVSRKAMRVARSSGKRYAPVLMEGKATVLSPCCAARARLLR